MSLQALKSKHITLSVLMEKEILNYLFHNFKMRFMCLIKHFEMTIISPANNITVVCYLYCLFCPLMIKEYLINFKTEFNLGRRTKLSSGCNDCICAHSQFSSHEPMTSRELENAVAC